MTERTFTADEVITLVSDLCAQFVMDEKVSLEATAHLSGVKNALMDQFFGDDTWVKPFTNRTVDNLQARLDEALGELKDE